MCMFVCRYRLRFSILFISGFHSVLLRLINACSSRNGRPMARAYQQEVREALTRSLC